MARPAPQTPAGPADRLRALAARVHPGAWPVLVGVAGLAGIAMVHLVDPHEPGHYPTCPWLMLTGTWCPGCGTMRAVNALSNLDIVGALQMNALFTVLVPYFLFHYFRWLYRSFRPQGAVRPPGRIGAAVIRWRRVWLLGILAVIIGYWVVRNTPFGAVLAPGGVLAPPSILF
ncbi:DUF2752 domain-containing protein [Nocardiopsis coralliicola]